MENIADALKMAGAALLFILAFALTITMFTKARQTTDAVLDNLNLDSFMQKVDPLSTNVTREVGIETIIPTLYRYCQSDDNIRIRILDKDGTELQVFDQEIESLVQSGLETDKLNDQTTSGYYKYLKANYATKGKPAYMFDAPWVNQNKQYYLERINAYIYGTGTAHMKSVDYSEDNCLMKYKKEKFEESYLEYRTSGIVYTDEYGEEIVRQQADTKVVITYKLK